MRIPAQDVAWIQRWKTP